MYLSPVPEANARSAKDEAQAGGTAQARGRAVRGGVVTGRWAGPSYTAAYDRATAERGRKSSLPVTALH